MQKDVWKGLFSPENKKMRSNVFLALMAGILLLAAGRSFSFFGGEAAEEPPRETQQAAAAEGDRATERRMAELLSKVEGAGQVDVMLTYRRTEEKTIAQDEVREETVTAEGGNTAEALRVEKKAVLTEDRSGNTLRCSFRRRLRKWRVSSSWRRAAETPRSAGLSIRRRRLFWMCPPIRSQF